jgi:two-component system chemotaxis sensor kinase CheA
MVQGVNSQPSDWQILVVEDEFDSIQMVSKILQHYGAEVHIAHNGFECLDILETLQPTLVIMDLALPEMDGWENTQAPPCSTSHCRS